MVVVVVVIVGVGVDTKMGAGEGAGMAAAGIAEDPSFCTCGTRGVTGARKPSRHAGIVHYAV